MSCTPSSIPGSVLPELATPSGPGPGPGPGLGAAAPLVVSSRRRAHWISAPVIVGMVVLTFWVVVALTVQWWAPYDPLEVAGPRLEGPSSQNWIGTDDLGRDVFTRTMYGARNSLPIAVLVILASVVIGSLVGSIAGFMGRWADSILMRLVDVTLAFPPILLAMIIAATLGPGLRNAFFAMIVVWWPIYARLLRGQVMAVKELDHVEAAVAIGASRPRILRRHILPLSMTPILVNATVDFGNVVLLFASLSFIGLGATPPDPEWGSMITEGAKQFYDWHIATAPGLAIFTVVLASNFVGDGLRDLFDPRG
ncbi:MAG: ABC transporter permease [bacterium]|nr:ABC transporter permease [bacterium]